MFQVSNWGNLRLTRGRRPCKWSAHASYVRLQLAVSADDWSLTPSQALPLESLSFRPPWPPCRPTEGFSSCLRSPWSARLGLLVTVLGYAWRPSLQKLQLRKRIITEIWTSSERYLHLTMARTTLLSTSSCLNWRILASFLRIWVF